MGAGIAMCFAEAGVPVTLHDSSSEALDRAMVRVAVLFCCWWCVWLREERRVVVRLWEERRMVVRLWEERRVVVRLREERRVSPNRS